MVLEEAFLSDLGVQRPKEVSSPVSVKNSQSPILPSSARSSIDQDRASNGYDSTAQEDPSSPSSPRNARRWRKGLWGMLQSKNPAEGTSTPTPNGASSTRNSLNLSRTSTQERETTPIAKRTSVGLPRTLTRDSDLTINNHGSSKKGNLTGFSFGKLLFGSSSDESKSSKAKEESTEESVLEGLGKEQGETEVLPSLPKKPTPEFENLPNLSDLEFPPPFPVSPSVYQLFKSNRETQLRGNEAKSADSFVDAFARRQAISVLVEETNSPIAFGSSLHQFPFKKDGFGTMNSSTSTAVSTPLVPKTPISIGKGSALSSSSASTGVSAAQRSVSAATTASVDSALSSQTEDSSRSKASNQAEPSTPLQGPVDRHHQSSKKTNVIQNNMGSCETISFYSKFGDSSDVSLGQLIEEMTSWVSSTSSNLDSDAFKSGTGKESGSVSVDSRNQDKLGSLTSKSIKGGSSSNSNGSTKNLQVREVHYVHGDHKITISAKHSPSTSSEKKESTTQSISHTSISSNRSPYQFSGSRKDPSTIEAEIDAVVAVLQTDKGSARTAVEVAETAVNLAVQGQVGTQSLVGKDGRKLHSNSIWSSRANTRDGKIGKGKFISKATYMMSFAKVIDSLLFNKELISGKCGSWGDLDLNDSSPSIQGQTLASIKKQLKSQFGQLPTEEKEAQMLNEAADRYNIVTLFKSSEALIKISIRPIVVFELLPHGPAITSTSTSPSGKPSEDKATINSPDRRSRISTSTSVMKEGSSEGKKLRDSTRLEIQKFFTDVKGHVSTLVSCNLFQIPLSSQIPN